MCKERTVNTWAFLWLFIPFLDILICVKRLGKRQPVTRNQRINDLNIRGLFCARNAIYKTTET